MRGLFSEEGGGECLSDKREGRLYRREPSLSAYFANHDYRIALFVTTCFRYASLRSDMSFSTEPGFARSNLIKAALRASQAALMSVLLVFEEILVIAG